MARRKNVGKTIALLILVIILILFGLIWFDYIGLIQVKKIFAPAYKLFGLETQTSTSITDGNMYADLESDRLTKRIESLELLDQELKKTEADFSVKEQQIEQILQELDERRKSLEEREQTFNNTVQKYDSREVNIEQNAKNLVGMEPQKAVAILVEMDDQDVIDVLRKTEEIAQRNKTMSMVSYWLSLMPADRVAIIQRKMTNKPLDIQ
ncbi:MAG: flagellar protein FlbB [Treponema sp.]|nr:flagellar protein FlbB [Treponema sp.]